MPKSAFDLNRGIDCIGGHTHDFLTKRYSLGFAVTTY